MTPRRRTRRRGRARLYLVWLGLALLALALAGLVLRPLGRARGRLPGIASA